MIPSPAKIHATSTVNSGNTCDITWRVTLLLLNPLSKFEPSFPPLADFQKQIKWDITEEVHCEISNTPERIHMPNTFSRERFASWASSKPDDECLSGQQLDTVLHFLDILYTECHMAINIGTLQDKSAILYHLTQAHPDD